MPTRSEIDTDIRNAKEITDLMTALYSSANIPDAEHRHAMREEWLAAHVGRLMSRVERLELQLAAVSGRWREGGAS